MSEPLELNEVLQGRKILGVEAGATPGWMLVNLEPTEKEREAHPGMRMFLTVFVGGRRASSPEDLHWSTCALHGRDPDGGGIADIVRDGRDPEMPMASANRALGR